MPDISQSLQGKDLQFLQQIAERWGVELQAQDLRSSIQHLSREMNHKNLFLEILDVMDDHTKDAVREISANDGKIPWAIFTRKYGDIRVMGAARRERERPDLNPINVTETLWYSAIVGKAFFNLQKEPLEYAYLPDEFMQFLSGEEPPLPVGQFRGRPATSLEKQVIIPITDEILDHLTTLLAAIRTEQPLEAIPWRNPDIPLSFLLSLAQAAALIDEKSQIQPKQVRQFMESSRAKALKDLVQAWMDGPFNDLRQLPGLIFEGQWQNPAQETRSYILHELKQLPSRAWWSLTAFVESIRQENPDFQRPAGDYDSWYIRRQDREEYLRGIRYWPELDGGVIRQIISRHMHWLGLVELGAIEQDGSPTAFHFSDWAEALMEGEHTPDLPIEREFFKIRSDGSIHIPRLTSRALRYQVARFSHLIHEETDHYVYQIRAESLAAAQKAGLKVEQFAGLLQKHGDKPIPPSVFTMLENWKNDGVQAHFAPVMLLTAARSEMIDALLSSRAGKYLGERLNPTTILVNEKQIKLVTSILAELGYLSDIQANPVVKIRKG